MTYQLAKQLKDAGFPQIWVTSNPKGTGLIPTDGPYIPSLSELIEACGKEFVLLWQSSEGSWQAEGTGHIVEFGSTPEEAVAKLWLALNT